MVLLMTYNNRNAIALIAVLFVYTALVILTVSLSQPQEKLWQVSLISPLSGIVFLFGFIGFLFYTFLKSVGDRIGSIESKIEEVENERDELSKNHEQVIEKRIFEIAVTNASLNREIAERMQAESEARNLQKRMELILNSAGDGIFGLDTSGNVTFANAAALLMIGWEAEDLIGKAHHELVHHSHEDGSPHDRNKCLIRQAYLDGIVHSSSSDCFWTKDGICFPVEYVSTPINDNGEITGAVVVFRDRSTYA
ncbi:MAG: PAS domain-containing protein [Desulfobulbaceae bacterium]|nr:MAG: PAS domain-containing protein [Desulfobulbaceae bacterium]